jgi:hypothetical protein
MTTQSSQSSILFFAILLTIFILCSLSTAVQVHHVPTNQQKPTDPDALWVEVDFPDSFKRGMYNNITFTVYNFPSRGTTASDYTFSLTSSSPTFFVPLLQPLRGREWCYDEHQRGIYTFRTQGNYIEVGFRHFQTGTALPSIKITCTIYASEIDPLRDNKNDNFVINLYNESGDEPIRGGNNDFIFPHPTTVLPQYALQELPSSVIHVPGGIEMSFAIYTSSPGALFASLLDIEPSIPISEQTQYKNSHNFVPRYSDDFYGRLNYDPNYNDTYSQSYVNKIQPLGNKAVISNQAAISSASVYCYLLDQGDLITGATGEIFSIENWSDLSRYYPRSAVWNYVDANDFGGSDIWFQTQGTHICRLFSRSYSGEIELRMVDLQQDPAYNFPVITLTIPSSGTKIPHPFWYISSATSTTITINYRLPTFERGDLIVVSKSAFNSTLPDNLSWYVDTILAPPSPRTCIPFSLNGTHIAWSYLPTGYITAGAAKFALEQSCMINLHVLTGHFQPKIALNFAVLPRKLVPYMAENSYEGIRTYNDLYSRIDMKQVLDKFKYSYPVFDEKNKKNNKGVDFSSPVSGPVRILSVNRGEGESFEYTSEQQLGQLLVHDVFDVNFDVFRPNTSGMDILTQKKIHKKMTLAEELYQLHNEHLSLSEMNSFENNNDLSLPYSSSRISNQNDKVININQKNQTPTPETVITSSFSPQQTDLSSYSSGVVQTDFVTGYRLLSITIKPLKMAISGTSFFDEERNATPQGTFPDLSDRYNIPTASTERATLIPPTQPLHLVLDFDRSFIQKPDNVDTPVFCYYIHGGQPTGLNIAWGSPQLHRRSGSYFQRLFVQLPATPANGDVSLRCQIPLPARSFLQKSTEISYFIQPGTVLETHALNLYNSYAKTTYTSFMERNKDLIEKAGNGDVNIPAYPKDLLVELGKSDKKYSNFNFDRLLSSNNGELDNTKLIEVVTYNNVSFAIDYGNAVDDDGYKAFISKAKELSLGDFIIPNSHFTILPQSNRNVISSLKSNAPLFWGSSANDYTPLQQPGNMTQSSAPTSIVDLFIFAFQGDFKTATINLYDHFGNMIIEAILNTPDFLTKLQISDEAQLRRDFRLISLIPIYSNFAFTTDNHLHRWYLPTDESDVVPRVPAVSLLGMDSIFDNTLYPTRVAVTFGFIRNVTPPPTMDINARETWQYFMAELDKLYFAKKMQFQFTGIHSIGTATGKLYYNQCLLKPDQSSEYIPLNYNNDYDIKDGDENNGGSSSVLPKDERGIFCGGQCEMLCPDKFQCSRNSDCYHGNCNSLGRCGPDYSYNYNVDLKSNGAVFVGGFFAVLLTVLFTAVV